MEYTPEHLINMDEKQLRKEYTRYRDMAQKRLKRLRNEGFGKSDIANTFAGGEVPKLSSLKDKESIAFAMAELKAFIDAKQSTVKGMREYIKEERQKAIETDSKLGEVIDTLNKHFPMGQKFQKDNIDLFFQFMNERVTYNVEKFVSSDRIAQLYKVAKGKGIKNLNAMIRTEKDLLFFVKNLENLEAVELPKGKYRSVKAFKQAIKDDINHGLDRSILYKQQYS